MSPDAHLAIWRVFDGVFLGTIAAVLVKALPVIAALMPIVYWAFKTYLLWKASKREDFDPKNL